MELAWVRGGRSPVGQVQEKGFQGWVSWHYSYDIGKAVVIKKIVFPSPLPLPRQGITIMHPSGCLCCGQPPVYTSKEKKYHLVNPGVGESRNAAFLVVLFSLRTVAHFDNTGQNKRARMRAAHSATSGQWTVSVHHLPGELFGAAMSRRILFLTPEIWFQFKIRASESSPEAWLEQ